MRKAERCSKTRDKTLDGIEIVVGRYWDTEETAITIIAVVMYAKGRLFDWAAYIGGTPPYCTREKTIEFVSKWGEKLLKEDAQHFFPQLPPDVYRE